MTQHIATGIDIGSEYTRIVIGEYVKDNEGVKKRILGTAKTRTHGVQKGNIVNKEEVRRSLTEALSQIARVGTTPKNVYVSIGGTSLSGRTLTGSTATSRADTEVTQLDIEKTIQSTKQALPSNVKKNNRILRLVPTGFRLDDEQVHGSPIGLNGKKLETDVFIVSALKRHIEDTVDSVESNELEIVDIVAAPIAAAIVNLTQAHRIAGAVLVDIGAEITEIIVYEDNMPLLIQSIPLGGNDITNKLALKLKIDLDEAETLKKTYREQTRHNKKKVEKIIMDQLKEIFSEIQSTLQEVGRDGLLPAGAIITGGGAHIPIVTDIAQSTLDLPSHIAHVAIGGTKKITEDPAWSVAYGLCAIGLNTDNQTQINIKEVTSGVRNILQYFKQLLP